MHQNILWFSKISIKDTPLVGGKNASLGEMIRNLVPKGVNIPNGFATTSSAYFYFLEKNNLLKQIEEILKDLNIHNLEQLSKKGKQIRELILKASLPEDLKEEILSAYRQLSQEYSLKEVDVAVRSSATAEDLPGASFAGQQETYLNIKGENKLLEAVKRCFASLFTDRAIVYRQEMGFSHTKVALSVGIQKMVRADMGASGVIFSCETESGFDDIILINASYGLGENVVQGKVEPDQYYIFETVLRESIKSGKPFRPIIEKRLGSKLIKMVYSLDEKKPTKNIKTTLRERESFVLSDEEILTLGRWAILIEDHYKKSMDIEWAKDGIENKLYIVQARPETVHSKKNWNVLEEYVLDKTKATKAKLLTTGLSVGKKIGVGRAHKILNVKEITKFKKGEVLITKATDPDWVPAMKLASAIVTDSGGRTCFDGNTKVLTDKGFLTIKEVVEKYKNDEINILSFNVGKLKLEWKRVLNGFSKESEVLKVNVSQNEKVIDNTILCTPDHEFLIFNERKPIFSEIKEILSKDGFLASVPNLSLDKNNYLNVNQIRNYDLPKIKDSDLKMVRAYFIGELKSQTVYDIEVADNHNYIVFTSKLTPLIAHNCHAAIVGRELGVPVVVGTKNGTKIIKQGQLITVDCSGGEEGKIYDGAIPFEIKKIDVSSIPQTRTKILMNVGEPSNAFNLSFIPNDGVGLAREEFIIANDIQIHPMALVNYKKLKGSLRKKIDKLTKGYKDKTQFYVDKLAEGIGKIASAFYPKPVIVRFSDFKTNEYRSLIGGELYEIEEENPMIGFRGASRYYNEKFREAFILECKAIKKARDVFGLNNIDLMIPFCRTVEEGKKVIEILEEQGLKRDDGLKIYVMCEIPSNVILAEEFLEIFDGFSIGSNDLTQLVLGLDRDNAEISSIGNENNPAVKEMIKRAIKICKEKNKYIGICGQAPSDFPEFAQFLVELGIESISLNPDSVLKTKIAIAQTEEKLEEKLKETGNKL